MNEKKHTPGTWKVQERKIEGEFVTTTHIVSQDDSHIAIVGPCNIEANARLIAAAPDLLAALTDLVGGCGKEGDLFSSEAMEKARAAIAKAERGEV